MTHDELLAYINKEIDQAAWTTEYYPFKSLQALRAVVELCTENTDHHLIDKDWVLKAIEKELGLKPSMDLSE